MGFLSEFKEFAVRGNVVDLAVAVVSGGAFVQSIIDFVLVAFAIFLAVKAINHLRRKPTPPPAEPAPPTDEVLLLREIRDALQARQS